jgi:hypothetical protein
MADSTRLLQEKEKLGAFQDQEKSEFFTFSQDDEMPFKADDSQANNLLGLVGQALRVYESGKLISMGYSQEAIHALLEQCTTGNEFPDAIQLMIERSITAKHRFSGGKVKLGQFKVADARSCVICGKSEREHEQSATPVLVPKQDIAPLEP